MPVKSLNSSVLKWPDRKAVDAALRTLALRLATVHPEPIRFGYFGSYARGDWDVGSDVDLVAIVSGSRRPFEERSIDFDLSGVSVAAELLIYTEDEWRRLQTEGTRFARILAEEAAWLTG